MSVAVDLKGCAWGRGGVPNQPHPSPFPKGFIFLNVFRFLEKPMTWVAPPLHGKIRGWLPRISTIGVISFHRIYFFFDCASLNLSN